MKKFMIYFISSFLLLTTVLSANITDVVNKVDNLVNPRLTFDTSKVAGRWYLLYDNDLKARKQVNTTMTLESQGEGFIYTLKAYSTATNRWITTEERSWFHENSKKIYMYTKHYGPLNNKNEVLYFSNDMNYLAIYFKKEKVIRIFTKSSEINQTEVENIFSSLKNSGYNVKTLKRKEFVYVDDPEEKEAHKSNEDKAYYERLSKFGESGTIDFENAVEVGNDIKK